MWSTEWPSLRTGCPSARRSESGDPSEKTWRSRFTGRGSRAAEGGSGSLFSCASFVRSLIRLCLGHLGDLPCAGSCAARGPQHRTNPRGREELWSSEGGQGAVQGRGSQERVVGRASRDATAVVQRKLRVDAGSCCTPGPRSTGILQGSVWLCPPCYAFLCEPVCAQLGPEVSV